MTEDLAVAIIKQAQNDGFYPDPMPETPDAVIADAATLVSEARSAFVAGARGQAVKSVLHAAGLMDGDQLLVEPVVVEPEPEPEPVVEEPVCETPQPSSSPSEPQAGSSASPGTISLAGAYESKELAIAKIKREKLPLPAEIEGEPPSLPRDVSVVGDHELRRLHSEFNSCLARVNWLLALEEADELAAKQIADHYNAKAIQQAGQKADPVTGKAKTVAALEAEAASDDNVREWRQKQTSHFIEIKLLKSLRDTFQTNCERISREYTMREGERQQSR